MFQQLDMMKRKRVDIFDINEEEDKRLEQLKLSEE